MTIPYQPALQQLPIEQVNALLDDKGCRLGLDCVNWKEQYPYKPLTAVYLARTDEMLFVKWHVNGIMLKGVYTNDMDPVHRDSCVEFFCLLADGRHYTNLEFNCIGTCSASRRLNRTEDVVPLTADELESIVRYSSLGSRPFCEIDGQFVWDLCVGIPLRLLDLDKHHLPQSIRCNFYKCADDTLYPHFVSWAPIHTATPDFHRPEYFADLEIEQNAATEGTENW
ncbi:MAG: hypothetical protein IJ169_03560 [Paludibacteraceae bacterium]|nr:hypothetical protein [Paludibacteraceae bacterium]